MLLDDSPAQEELPSAAILLGALEKLGETVPKDTICVLGNCHDVMPNSWPKSLSIRRMIDHGIELLPEVKASAKNAYHMASPELTKLQKPSKMWSDPPHGVKYFPKSDIRSRYCQVRAMKAEGLETTCVTGLGAYEFPMVPFNLTDAKEGKCCSV
ncbi:reverse transcriptase [Cucumis melo var. makuwa]|uniref:Reverse transcriptase n=1 Tax=Cucumis melo var. makuwa TaxID=1194695 RepID=A0A5D3D159_CUCMM|nr:reverse transcriptase [Cucumis melo var. makuwa]TYK17981.1 reverse transcriptase [Cucumis melo var. makuwa]